MKTIHKYPLEQAGEQTINSHEGAEFLAVQVQHDEACLWVLFDPAKQPWTYKIRIYGTGHMVYEDHLLHLGTFQLHQGRFVGHAFLELPV